MPSCPFCEKIGLPILPVRYAVARKDGAANAPGLLAPFSQSIELPEDSAQYTLRLLRSGYLYVYDAGIDWWSAYVVTEQGNLFEFDIQAKSPPDVGDKHPCSQGFDPYMARCITVPDVQSATQLWLGFSDTAWTQAVLDKHQDASYRQAHMTCIDVQQWLKDGANQAHMTTLESVAWRVAEFAPGCQGGDAARTGLRELEADDNRLPQAIKRRKIAQNKAQIPFCFADDSFQQLGECSEALVDWAKQQGQETVTIAQLAGMDQIAFGTPAIVGLDDPIGIGVDLNGLIVQLLEEWQQLDDKERLWKQVTSKSIQALEEMVKSQAVKHRRERYKHDFAALYNPSQGATLYKEQAQQAAQEYAQRFTPNVADAQERQALYDANVQLYYDTFAPPGGFVEKDKLAQRQEQYVQQKLAEDGGVEAIRDAAWARYTQQDAWIGDPLYNEQQRQSDDEAFQQALTSYDEAHITPISTAWLAWAQSDLFKAKFTHNHDPDDIDSGMSFVTLATHAVRNATGRADVKSFLAKELAKDPKQRNNIWVRALAMDQHALGAQLDAGSIDLNSPSAFSEQGALFLLGVGRLLEPEHQAKAREQTEKTRQWLAARQAQLVPIQNRMANYMRETGGAMLEALGELPQDLVLGSVQTRLLTAMAGAGYDSAAIHYVFTQQAMLTWEQKLSFITRVLQQVTTAPNSTAPAPIKHVIHAARVDTQGTDHTPAQPMRGLAWVTQDGADQLGLAAEGGEAPGKAGQWRVSPQAMGQVDAETFAKTQAASTRLVTLDSAAFHVGVVGMLLSTWSFAGMAKQEFLASAGKMTHLTVAAGTLAGQYMEVTGAVLQDTKWGSTRLSKPLNSRFIRAATKAERLAGIGKILGALGGLVLGVWQLTKGGMEYYKNRSLALFDIAIGGMTASLSILILFGSLTGLGFVLLIALAIVAFIWHFFVNDQYQNWLTRCYYGAGPNKFENMAEQQTAFHRITTPKKTSKESEEGPAKKHLHYGYRQIPGVS